MSARTGGNRTVRVDREPSGPAPVAREAAGRPERFTFTVDAAAPDRVDRLIVAELARLGRPTSRATVQRWIDDGQVLADGQPCRASSVQKRGVQLDVVPSAEPSTAVIPDASVRFTIVFEDEDLIVVDKPAGLVVHPARGHWDGTLVHGLVAHGLDLAGLDERDGAPRPGIVHRLDKGTSGLLVVAKNPSTREALKELFARHDIQREYIALVVGQAENRRIDTLHGRKSSDRTKFTSIGLVRGGKRAVTTITVAERLEGASLVVCTLETGRTHQIRVHLAEQMQTPVLGDPVYGSRPSDRKLASIALGLGRQALHARVLGFVHPRTGRAMAFSSDPPADMQAAIDELRAIAKLKREKPKRRAR